MRVLVCGGRDFTDQLLLEQILDRLHQERSFKTVIDGAARDGGEETRQAAFRRG